MGQDIRAVLFDVGGVIATQDERAADTLYGRARPGLTAADVNGVRHGPELYPLWAAYSVAAVGSGAYWSAVASALGLDDDAGAVLESVHAATVWSVVDPDVRAVVADLRRDTRLRLGVLSNSSPECEAHVPLFSAAFEVLHFSHRTRRRKPDADAYEAVCGDLGVPPAEAAFVDDKARNVEAATRLGMRAFVFRGAAALAGDLAWCGVSAGTSGPVGNQGRSGR